ncbi:MAG: PAS domain S-box protein [Bdellovibrionota bacterium]
MFDLIQSIIDVCHKFMELVYLRITTEIIIFGVLGFYLGYLIFKRLAATRLWFRLKRNNLSLVKLATSYEVSSGNLEDSFQKIIKQSARRLKANIASVWTVNETVGKMECAVIYNRMNNSFSDGAIANISDYPKFFSSVQRDRIHTINDLDNSKFATEFKDLLKGGDYKSILSTPVRVDGNLVALACHCHIGEVRKWTLEEQSFAASIADILAMSFYSAQKQKYSERIEILSRTIESSVDGMAILDAEGRFVYMNDAHAQIYGYEVGSELLGKTWEVLYETAEQEIIRNKHLPRLELGANVRINLDGLKKDGTKFPCEANLKCTKEGGIICICRDVSDLTKSKKFLRAVIDLDPNFIFVKDRAGRFTLANQAVAEAYGTTPEDLIGKTDADFNSSPEEVEHFRLDDLRVIDHGEELFIPEEMITDSKGAVRYLQTVKRPLRLSPNDDCRVLGVATDITRLRDLQSQLAHSQKMEAVGQLAGGIAHDFNNLLTGILGYASLIKTTDLNRVEREKIGIKLETAAERAAELTQKLLGFARKGKNRNVPIDLHSVIRETTSMIKRVFPKNIIIKQELADQPAVIKGDPTQIQQVVLNLAINARDAMTESLGGTEGGTLKIETRVLGSKIQVLFSDSGCGIPSEIRPKIFEPFFTTKPQQRGTGMGLAMVYGIVENHGGNVRFRSRKNRGTVFTVSFPAVNATELVETITTHTSISKGEGRILVVDDNQLVLSATAQMLTAMGYQVETADQGWAAIKRLKELKGGIDLIILDMIMPELSAEETFNRLKAIDPEIKVLLSTGYEANQSVQKLLNLGMAGFISKPYEMTALSKAVSKALQGPYLEAVG